MTVAIEKLRPAVFQAGRARECDRPASEGIEQ